MNAATTAAQSAPGPALRAPARHPGWQWPVLGLAAVAALYLVGRGVAELFLINWSDPASYAGDWGGPSLFGVLAVHSGPALLILASVAWWLLPPDQPDYPSEG